MPRTKPAPGRYRLTPSPPSTTPPHEVYVDSTPDQLEEGALTPYPWDSAAQEYRRDMAGGYTYGWGCNGDGTYVHFVFAPPGSTPPLTILEEGTCVWVGPEWD